MRGSESGPVELFYFQKWAKNIKKKSSESLLRECETEYQSEI